jgi:hypothetical protein
MADFNRRISGYDCVKRVLGGQGLPIPVSASGSQNALDRQIWALLTEVGQDLLEKHNWQGLNNTYTITTVPGQTTYPLPNDFQSFIDSTAWNNNARLPLIGPMSDQDWALLQARQLGGTTLRMQYIIQDDNVEFYAVPTEVQTITMPYISRGWVRDATNPLLYRDYVANDGDTIMYAPRLIIAALKRRFRIEKGFDATAADEEYRLALEAAKYNDSPKKDLSLNSRAGYPYLGYWNMPDTNYGTP